jgi:hypothetical protein
VKLPLAACTCFRNAAAHRVLGSASVAAYTSVQSVLRMAGSASATQSTTSGCCLLSSMSAWMLAGNGGGLGPGPRLLSSCKEGGRDAAKRGAKGNGSAWRYCASCTYRRVLSVETMRLLWADSVSNNNNLRTVTTRMMLQSTCGWTLSTWRSCQCHHAKCCTDTTPARLPATAPTTAPSTGVRPD